MPTIPRPVDPSEVYQAILHLLNRNGIYHPNDHVVVTRAMSSSGRTVYVVVANGIGCAVTNAIASVIAPRELPRSQETLVLSEHEVGELVRCGRRRFF